MPAVQVSSRPIALVMASACSANSAAARPLPRSSSISASTDRATITPCGRCGEVGVRHRRMARVAALVQVALQQVAVRHVCQRRHGEHVPALRAGVTAASALAMAAPTSSAIQVPRATPTMAAAYGVQVPGRSIPRTIGDGQETAPLERWPPHEPRRHGRRAGQLRSVEERLRGNSRHPADERGDPRGPDERDVMLSQQGDDRRRVAGRGGVLERLLDEPLLDAPAHARRRIAAGTDRIDALLVQQQQIAEEVMEAEPLAAAVEPDDERWTVPALRPSRPNPFDPARRRTSPPRTARARRPGAGSPAAAPPARRAPHPRGSPPPARGYRRTCGRPPAGRRRRAATARPGRGPPASPRSGRRVPRCRRRREECPPVPPAGRGPRRM